MGDYRSSDDEYSNTYDDDYDDFDDSRDGFQAVETEFTKSSAPSTKVITKESLLAAQREDLLRVMDLLSLKENHARTLLIHYRWDVEKVFSVLAEYGKDKLFAEAGVTIVERDDHYSFEDLCCNICFDDVSPEEVTTMDCGHYFCNSCWMKYFIMMINEGKSRRIRCMEHKCNAICDEAKIRQLVSAEDADLVEKFDRFLLESYIEDNRRVKWCPSVPHCGNAIRTEVDELCEVECACGLQFCFSCSFEAHSPCSCEMWKLWLKKCQDDWITVCTKPCPKCQKLIEKNGGCNHVSCVCGQSFCWLCGAATGQEHTWTEIAGHSCGRYREDLEKEAECAKRNPERYTHYHNRYKAHTDSLKLESKMKERMQKKINRLEETEISSKDFSWVISGLNRLFRSRRILSFSYPFAFYMFGDDLFKDEMTKEERGIKQNLFEYQQQQFESNIERLSLCFEEIFVSYSDNDIEDLKMRIIALATAIDNLCRNLHELTDTELLGSLKFSVHEIAPYKSNGVERASELLNC